MKTYAVMYRTGGTLNFKWNRLLGGRSLEMATKDKAELERGGYPTIIEDYKLSMSVGVPETFDASQKLDLVMEHFRP